MRTREQGITHRALLQQRHNGKVAKLRRACRVVSAHMLYPAIPLFKQADSGSDSDSRCHLSAAYRQTGIFGADCRPVAIMELTSEDAALLLIAKEDIHLKLKRERSGVNEINELRGQYGEYHHHICSQLKANGERFFFSIF
jgi:hypothetical protein